MDASWTLGSVLNLLRVVAALPGRLLIRWIDGRKRSNGVPPLGAFLRGCVHGFVWLVVLMAFAMATAPVPASVAAPVVRTAPRYVPPPVPADTFEPAPTSAATPTTSSAPVYVPLPDDDDDGGESRFCRKRWWC